MDKFKLETSFQFPFFKLNELVSYSEVKKPSGVQYMILVLINESKNRNALISTTLNNFGVPKNLFEIFSGAIKDLINNEIIEIDSSDYNQYIENLRIGDFRFTKKGKKVFDEESIPTGVIKEAKIPFYYNIAMNELSLNLNNDMEPKPLMDSALTPDFFDNFICKKDEEHFINVNKGVRIPIYENGKVVKNELIKREEVITNVERLTKENWTAKYDCDILIEKDDLIFKFDDKPIENFFKENYSADIVNKFIRYKTKFKFFQPTENIIKLSDFNSDDIVNILVPKDINDVLKQKGQLIITKGRYHSSNIYEIDNIQGLTNFNNACEFVIVDQADNKYGYVSGIFCFKNEDFGDIYIPLLVKIKVSNEKLKEILSPFVCKLSSYSEDNFRALVKVSVISKDYDKAFEIMKGYLGNSYESNIVILNEMKQFAILNVNIFEKYKRLLKDNYFAYLETINEDNVDTVLKISNGISKFLNISNKEILDKIFSSLGNIKSEKSVYEILVKNGFDKASVALYVNPVPEALKTRNAEEKSLSDLINYDSRINTIKKNTGINDSKEYSFNEEDIDKSTFKSDYITAYNLKKNISFFESKNKELFSEYNKFMTIFGKINDDFNMLEAALKNPNNIKPEIIEKKIVSGDYQFVFVNLSAKLESILKSSKYQLDGKLSDMLSNARRNGLIDRTIVSDLHDFRENRNAYIHPEDRKSNFRTDDLRRWSDEIFKLQEEEK